VQAEGCLAPEERPEAVLHEVREATEVVVAVEDFQAVAARMVQDLVGTPTDAGAQLVAYLALQPGMRLGLSESGWRRGVSYALREMQAADHICLDKVDLEKFATELLAEVSRTQDACCTDMRAARRDGRDDVRWAYCPYCRCPLDAIKDQEKEVSS